MFNPIFSTSQALPMESSHQETVNYSNWSVEYVIHLVPSGGEHLDYGIGEEYKNYSDNAVRDESIHPEGNRKNNV
jgi:hypothetical protein